jgi:anaerobic magnesium-protoporphyrin IX monomethyl ester cyclase
MTNLENINLNKPLKIVLLRTPMVVPKMSHAFSICPPLGLAYVASAIQKANFEVRSIDALGEAPFQKIIFESNKNFLNVGLSTPQILEHLEKEDFDILFVSLMFSHDWPMSKVIIKEIKKKYPNKLLVCGGEHITASPEFCMEDCPEIDICIFGEGEETSVELLKAVQQKKSLSAVSGIVFKLDDKINRTPNRARINKIDNITWPAWDLFPLETYLSNGFGYGVNSGRSMPMLISRGCPFQCTFCSSPQMWTTKWQARSADCVLDEMQYYINKYKAQNFDFYDLTTIVRKDWILDFCNKLIKKKWNITWQMPAGTRSEALDDESLGLMVESGQRNISYAPESGSANTLKKIKKKIKIVTMKKSIKSALSKNMNVKLNLMMGFPHETHRDIFDTFVFIKDAAAMGVHDAYIACFAPYPGSELFDELHKSGKIKSMDDEYFLNLTSYSDLLHSYSYSPHLNNAVLTFYRLSGMLMFYIISFTLHPKRIFRLFSNVKNKKEESRLDMALIQLIDRFKGSKKAKKI